MVRLPEIVGSDLGSCGGADMGRFRQGMCDPGHNAHIFLPGAGVTAGALHAAKVQKFLVSFFKKEILPS
jgi:hypothetical protein